MVKVAFLGRQFPQQVSTNPEELRELQVAWVGSDVEAFRREVPALECKAVVLDISEGSASPIEVRELINATRAELAIVTYSFATRAFLRELRGDHVRVLQAPLSLSVLRAHLAFLVVQDLLRRDVSGTLLGSTRAAPHGASCTCGDGVQRLVGELVATEASQRNCPARPARGEGHHQLEGLTRQARVVLEDALLVARPPFDDRSSGFHPEGNLS